MGRTHVGEVHGELSPMGGSPPPEEEGAAETMCDELTTTPIPHPPAPPLRGEEAKQPQFPQPLLIGLLLQTLHQLHRSLDMLQHLNVFLVLRGPKLNTVFEVRPHQCRVQGHDHFPSPAGHAIFDTSQDAIGFLGHLGTLLAHMQPAADQHPQVLFCQAAFQPLFPKPVALHGVVVTQVQDLTLSLVEPHTIVLSPSIQPVQIKHKGDQMDLVTKRQALWLLQPPLRQALQLLQLPLRQALRLFRFPLRQALRLFRFPLRQALRLFRLPLRQALRLQLHRTTLLQALRFKQGTNPCQYQSPLYIKRNPESESQLV
ncbi:hypothetical protein QYF61_018449 [Mycteria americana]|uniref:Uncharacterized protein n=1 Tax=Mycteria americana TaxID=33587 RepID=A0AAN7RTD8_MYCAM|nr:hypothetical protein QYF61_018449 [Mycteria americana]